MKKILVIDDDSLTRHYLSILLEQNKYQVITAENGKDGTKISKEVLPDLIVCDVLLPDIDGFQVIKDLQKCQSTKNIPLILISACRTEINDMRAGMELGADDYLIKPLSAEDILKSIEIRIRKFQELSKIQKPNHNNTKTHSRSKKSEKSKWILIRGGNIELINTERIMYLLAEADYTKVFTEDGKKHRVSRLLKNWEEILPKDNFLRIHRSTIINLDFVKKIEKWFNNTYRVYIQNMSEPLTVSRRYVHKVKSYFLELPN